MTTFTQTIVAAKRRYTKLTEAEWAEAEAAWASGSATLPELAHRTGVTERGLQARFARRGLQKGEAAKAIAAQVVARVKEQEAARVDTLVERAAAIRETAYANAVKVERMIVDRLDAAAADPSQTFAASAAIKMMVAASAALERLHTLKRSALGISDDDVNDDEVPVLVVRDLTDAETDAIRAKQDEEDDAYILDENETETENDDKVFEEDDEDDM